MSRSTLTASQRKVLGALMSRDVAAAQSTVEAVAGSTGLHVDDVRCTMRRLDSIEPRLVRRQTDAATGIDFWVALEPVIVALEERQEAPQPRRLAAYHTRPLRALQRALTA
jgi:hypothetical protein